MRVGSKRMVVLDLLTPGSLALDIRDTKRSALQTSVKVMVGSTMRVPEDFGSEALRK